MCMLLDQRRSKPAITTPRTELMSLLRHPLSRIRRHKSLESVLLVSAKRYSMTVCCPLRRKGLNKSASILNIFLTIKSVLLVSAERYAMTVVLHF
jgi:hypothetical protein